MEALNSLGLDLVEIEYCHENRAQMLRIFIDRESGVDLSTCSEATRAIKKLIDECDIFYDYLEVSSPGLDRVLKNDEDFIRFSGEKVKVKTLKAYNGPRKTSGILRGLSGTAVLIEQDGQFTEIPRDMITIIRLDPDN
ncbi:MAG: ribosome maturation factor RimP [Syntrophomonas sp.]